MAKKTYNIPGKQNVTKQEYDVYKGKTGGRVETASGQLTPLGQTLDTAKKKEAELTQAKQTASALGLKEPGQMLTTDVAGKSIEALREHSTQVEEALMKLSAAQASTTPQAEQPKPAEEPQAVNPANPLSLLPEGIKRPVKTAAKVVNPVLKEGQTQEQKATELATLAGAEALTLGGITAAQVAAPAMTTGITATTNTALSTSLFSKVLGLGFLGGFAGKIYNDKVGDVKTAFQGSKMNLNAVIRSINQGADPVAEVEYYMMEKENIQRYKKALEQLQSYDLVGTGPADNALEEINAYEKYLNMHVEPRIRNALLKSQPGQQQLNNIAEPSP